MASISPLLNTLGLGISISNPLPAVFSSEAFEGHAKQLFTLGKVTFHSFEAPSNLSIFNEQRHVVHEFVGGGRTVQALGTQPGPIRWSGRLVPIPAYVNEGDEGRRYAAIFSPINRALDLQLMCALGQPVPLIFSSLSWSALITHFSYEILNVNEVLYTIDLVVIEEHNTAVVLGLQTTDFLHSVEFAALVDITGGLFAAIEERAEILAILGASTIQAIRIGESALAGIAALATTDAAARTFGLGLGLIDKANKLMRAAALMRAIGRDVGLGKIPGL